MLGSEQEAEDVLYEAFSRLWQHEDGSRTPHTDPHHEARLTATVRHLSIDTLRRRAAHPSISLDEPNAQEWAHTARSITDETEEESNMEERLEQVQRLIDRHLSPVQQRILRQRDIEGATYADIAAETGMQETAVRQQLSRARRTIRQLYQQQQHPAS